MRYEYTVTKESGEAEIWKQWAGKNYLKAYYLNILNLMVGVHTLINEEIFKPRH